MLIPLGGYAGGGTTSLWELAGIVCGAVFCIVVFLAVGGLYFVACIFVAELLGNVMLFPFVFFGAGTPLLILTSRAASHEER